MPPWVLPITTMRGVFVVLPVAFCAGCLMLLSARASAEAPSKAPAQGHTASAVERPAFARATQIYRPLADVAGAAKLWQPAKAQAPTSFAKAIAYAGEQASFSLLIWHDARLQLEHYFPGYSADLRAESASMHKSVVGFLVAAAIADGTIASADVPIGTYVPQWADDARGQIPLRSFLTMTSGLKPLSRAGGAQAEGAKFFMDGSVARQMLLERPLIPAQRGQFHYSEVDTQALVLVLEAATGIPYNEYLSRRLWQPMGAAPAKVWLYEPDGFPKGHVALLARALDWLRLGLLILGEGALDGREIIPAHLIQQVIAPSPANPNYGWQVWRGATHQNPRFYSQVETGGFHVAASAPYLLDDLIYFDGFGGQRVYISPSQGLIIVRTGAPKRDWDDAILPNLVIEALGLSQHANQ